MVDDPRDGSMAAQLTRALTTGPEPGTYKRKLVKGGVWVPARIWIEEGEYEVCEECGGSGRDLMFMMCDGCGGDGRSIISDDVIRCQVNGEEKDPFDQWTYLAGNPISQAEYDYLMADLEHARRYRPDDPQADPRKPVDWLKTRPIF